MPPGSERFALADVHQFQIGLHHGSSHQSRPPHLRSEAIPLYGSSQALMRSIGRAAAKHPHHAGEITDTFLTVFCQKLNSASTRLTVNVAESLFFLLNLP